MRFDTASLTDVLVRRGRHVRLRDPLERLPRELPTVLATGGFHASRDLVAEHITEEPLLRRGNPWSSGDGLVLALEEGARTSAGMDEFYGRAMPQTPNELPESGWRRLAQLYARHTSRIESLEGEVFDGELSWHEVEVVQWMARQPGARRATACRTISSTRRCATAPCARWWTRHARPAPRWSTSAARGGARGGRHHEHARRAQDRRGRALPDGLFACGTDAGGLHTGGYASGLAAALVFGRIAADSALDVAG